MKENKYEVINRDSIGIFALGITLSVVVVMITSSEGLGIATSICYATAVISNVIRHGRL